VEEQLATTIKINFIFYFGGFQIWSV